jgi:molybdate transport system substrate-binding protein
MRAAAVAVFAIALLSVLAFAGIRSIDRASEAQDSLTVFAAASLRNVAGPLESAWIELEPDVPLTLSFAGSNVLAAQIAEGAPADVFLSADRDHAEELMAAELGTGLATFAGNRLALAAADATPIRAAIDLSTPGTRIVAAHEDVPISRYATELLARIAATTADPEAYLAGAATNVVSREDNVRSALAKVELGEGDAAIVYASDLLDADAVRQIDLPPGTDVMATYAALQISERAAAAGFIEWLQSEQAQRILADGGFHPPPR